MDQEHSLLEELEGTDQGAGISAGVPMSRERVGGSCVGSADVSILLMRKVRLRGWVGCQGLRTLKLALGSLSSHQDRLAAGTGW